MAIKNPLEKFVPVEDRADGTYIKVTREAKSHVTVGELISACDNAMVLNFDGTKIQEVYDHGRGAFEKIGPIFKYYNPTIEKFLSVAAASPFSATLKVSSMCLVESITPMIDDILFFLRRKGITEGIQLANLQKFAEKVIFDTEFEIAVGREAVNGTDGQVEMVIDVDHHAQPKMLRNGSVDFHDLNKFALVKQGDVIARRIPPTSGISGRTVLGKDILPTPGQDVQFPAGKNTQISQDGTQLVAVKSGYLYREGSIIHIGEMLHISGNVDFGVGNIKYSGDVVIDGNVMPGFNIESEGNILIKGEVESSKITSRNGTVTIQKGVVGKGDTFIFGKKGVTLAFAQQANITSDATITIEKYCLHCTCVCNEFDVSTDGAGVFGGTIQMFSGGIVWDAGNQNNVLTKFVIIDKQKLEAEEKIKELGAVFDKLTKEIQPIKRELKSKSAIFKKAGDQVSARHKEELQKWLDVFIAMNQKLKYTQGKIDELKNLAASPESRKGTVIIKNQVFPGVDLDFYGNVKKITAKGESCQFRYTPEGIERV